MFKQLKELFTPKFDHLLTFTLKLFIEIKSKNTEDCDGQLFRDNFFPEMFHFEP